MVVVTVVCVMECGTTTYTKSHTYPFGPAAKPPPHLNKCTTVIHITMHITIRYPQIQNAVAIVSFLQHAPSN